jgi:hypothetical protein
MTTPARITAPEVVDLTNTSAIPLGPHVIFQALVMRQGATYRARYTWKEGGVPQSLEGVEARLSVARRKGRTPVFTISSINGEIVLEDEGNVGQIDFRINPDKTRLLRKDSYYDLVLIDMAEPTEVIRLLEGPVTVDPMTTPTEEPML